MSVKYYLCVSVKYYFTLLYYLDYFTLFMSTCIQYNGLFVLIYLLVLSIHIIKYCKESMNIFDILFFRSFIIYKPLINQLHWLLHHLDEFIHLISADVWSQMD